MILFLKPNDCLTVLSRKLVAVESYRLNLSSYTDDHTLSKTGEIHLHLNATLQYKAVLKLALSQNTPISSQSLLAVIFSDHDIHPSAKAQRDWKL